MAYNSNPFLERMSERTTSDMEFVRLFSPRILEKLADEAWRSRSSGEDQVITLIFANILGRLYQHRAKLPTTA